MSNAYIIPAKLFEQFKQRIHSLKLSEMKLPSLSRIRCGIAAKWPRAVMNETACKEVFAAIAASSAPCFAVSGTASTTVSRTSVVNGMKVTYQVILGPYVAGESARTD
jgi:hypothetical protein